tara:strand:- start:84984 stop:86150 length:1167 start_codon:yes stop_codon:yes gene_type:complete
MKLNKVICGLCLLFITTFAQAHLLNMTDLLLDTTNPEAVTLRVKIDLGQSLLSPQDYWRTVNMDSSEQWVNLEPAVNKLLDGLGIFVNGVKVAANIETWSLTAASLEAIENPLSPQMAELTFNFGNLGLESSTALAYASIEMRIAEWLEVPWPALLRIDSASRQLPVSRLLTSNDRSSRSVPLSADSAVAGSSFTAKLVTAFQGWIPGLSWLAIGFQHIIPWGLDHIVFVLGLFFLSTRLSTLFYQVSCFTVAHSLSLGLATLGMVSVPASIVEPLIAASIIFIAVDNLYSPFLARWRLVVVTLFGLLHGLGFASALSELMLPAENFYTALLMFNLGVEAGQITVLALAFAAVGWLRGWSAYTERVARPATVTIAGVGTYWLLKRVVF